MTTTWQGVINKKDSLFFEGPDSQREIQTCSVRASTECWGNVWEQHLKQAVAVEGKQEALW